MRRLSTRTDFTFGFAAAICACWMIAAFFSDHFETGGKRSDIYSWISLRPYRNPEACIGVRLRMATSLFIWPVGNAQTLFSGISYSPYRNPEAGGVRTSGHRRPASSSDFGSARCFYFGLFLRWRETLRHLIPGISYSPYRNPKPGSVDWRPAPSSDFVSAPLFFWFCNSRTIGGWETLRH